MAGEAGKGSRPRPYSVSKEKYDSNWDLIFKKKEQVDGKDESRKSNDDQDRQDTVGSAKS
jgi:hypothetical protein